MGRSGISGAAFLVADAVTFGPMSDPERTRSWNLGPDGWGWSDLVATGWGELVVSTRAMLLLPSDLAALRRGEVPRLRALVGDVIEAGEDAPFHPGMRIFPAWRGACGRCEACQRGNETLCPDWVHERVDPVGPAHRMRLPSWNARRGCVALSLADAPAGQVFLQPLATAVRLLRRANPAHPQRLAVVGDGPMGRLWGMLLEVRYPAARRGLLERTAQDGALHGFHVQADDHDSLEAKLDGQPDLIVVLQPTGEILREALDRVCPGGIVIASGETQGPQQIELEWFSSQEKRLVSASDAGPRDFKAAAGLLPPLMGRLSCLAPAHLVLKPGSSLPPAEELVDFQVIEWTSEATEE